MHPRGAQQRAGSVAGSDAGTMCAAARFGGAKQHLDSLRRQADHEAVPQTASRSQTRHGDRPLPHRTRPTSPISRPSVALSNTPAKGRSHRRWPCCKAWSVTRAMDGRWTLEELDRYYEASAARNFAQGGIAEGPTSLLQLSQAPETEFAREHVGTYLDAAALLGRRTAEMHLALASPTQDPAFMPEPLTSQDIDRLREELIAARQQRLRCAQGKRSPLARWRAGKGRPGAQPQEPGARPFPSIVGKARSMRCAPASTGTIIWDRCFGPKATSSFWTSRVSRRARLRSAGPSSRRSKTLRVCCVRSVMRHFRP